MFKVLHNSFSHIHPSIPESLFSSRFSSGRSSKQTTEKLGDQLFSQATFHFDNLPKSQEGRNTILSKLTANVSRHPCKEERKSAKKRSLFLTHLNQGHFLARIIQCPPFSMTLFSLKFQIPSFGNSKICPSDCAWKAFKLMIRKSH